MWVFLSSITLKTTCISEGVEGGQEEGLHCRLHRYQQRYKDLLVQSGEACKELCLDWMQDDKEIIRSEPKQVVQKSRSSL